MMVGRELDNLYPHKAKSRNGQVVLKTEHLSRNGKFDDVSIEFKAGEITGIFGLVGAGRTEFAWSVFGADRIDGGKVFYEGNELNLKSPTQAIKNGIAYLTEDRKRLGLFLGMDVKDNAIASNVDAVTNKMGILDNSKIYKITQKYIDSLEIHPNNCEDSKIYNLSGGNQQKVLLSKWLAANPRVLIVDEPTRGVDVGAKSKIHNILRQLADSGMTIVMISSELPEILGLSDRVAVMCEGKLIDVMENDNLTEEYVLTKAFNKGGAK